MRARIGAGPVEQVAGAAGEVAEHRVEQLLEVGALGGRLGRSAPRAAAAASIATRRSSSDEARRHLLAELVHRRVQAGRVKQVRELRGVAIEVRLEHPADAADGAVALLVEELVDHPRRAPRSPRKRSSVRGAGRRRPRSSCAASARARRRLAVDLLDWRIRRSNSVLTTSTRSSRPRPGAPRARSAGRARRGRLSSPGRSARKASRGHDTRRSTTMRSPSRRMRVGMGVGSPLAMGVGSGWMVAESMGRTVAVPRDI